MAVKRPRILGIVAIGLLAVLVVAWIDGGDEPIRQITVPVEVPENAR